MCTYTLLVPRLAWRVVSSHSHTQGGQSPLRGIATVLYFIVAAFIATSISVGLGLFHFSFLFFESQLPFASFQGPQRGGAATRLWTGTLLKCTRRDLHPSPQHTRLSNFDAFIWKTKATFSSISHTLALLISFEPRKPTRGSQRNLALFS